MSAAAQPSTVSAPRTAHSSAASVTSTSTSKSNRMIYIRDEHGHFVCPTCGITKKNQSTMHYHMKTHDISMEFVCKTCHKEFIHAQALKIHTEARHGKAKKTKEHGCPIRDCPFESGNKGNCRTHFMRIHCAKETGDILERNLETGGINCTNCGGEFGSLSAFYYHTVMCVDLLASDARAKLLERIL
jgi:DNA-directed RNA polymerase subunit RPC12/RpoP